MRPVELKLSGLRSYRDEQLIDFTGVNLMAIIGDTGAGKSSLLEAICFALYGVCTWPVQGGGGGPLIAASGDGVLRVEFTFRVKGETWKVTRTASHGVTPPHHLKCIDTGEEVDGSRKVTERVSELIGIDSKTFLKAVMLPQGKFQELLQSSETERNALLKSVLDLGSLSEMRTRARAMHERLMPLLHETELQRGRLPLDPAADLADAAGRFADASKVLDRLEVVRKRVADARASADAAGRREKELRQAGKRLSDQFRPGLHDDFTSLILLETRFAENEVSLRQELGQHEEEVRRLEGELEDAERRGVGVAATASASTVLASMAEQVPAWHEERALLDAERAAIAKSLGELEERANGLAMLAAKVEEAAKAAEVAACESDIAAENVKEFRSLLDAVRTTASLAVAADDRVHVLREKAEKLGADAGALAGEHQEAVEALEKAQGILYAAQQADAAVHAAAGSSAGDACPICTRTLPESYQPPPGADISAAEKAVRTAQKTCTAAETAKRQAEKKWHMVEGELDREVEVAQLAGGARDDSLAEARARLGTVDLEVADDVLLSEVIRSAAAAKMAAEAATTAMRTAETKHSNLRTTIDTVRPLIKQRDQDAKNASDALHAEWKAIEDSLRAVPFYRDDEITLVAIEAATGRVRAQETALGRLRIQKKEAQVNVVSSREELEKLGRQRNEQIERPRAALVGELGVLVERASVVLTVLGREGIGNRRSEATLSDDSAWAADTVARVASTVEVCVQEANLCRAKVEAAQKEIVHAYGIAEVSDEEQLEALIRSTNVEVETAKREHQVAEETLPICHELDSRLAAARPVVKGLHELVKLLADGKFVNSVVQRRQGTLLKTAGRILQSMTDGRFDFTEKFKIIDTSTGQVRDVKTLSGGETFLASLALALALVEITSRGAGRVEALFLDEGFGTLDTNALHQALGELHRNAGEDRLVAVISHMRDVAENFESILMVEKSPRGSSARWLSPEERDELMADDLASGLRS